MATVTSAAPAKATLKIVKLNPLTIRGSGFKPVERVTVTLSAGAAGTAKGTATAAGATVAIAPRRMPRRAAKIAALPGSVCEMGVTCYLTDLM